MKIWTKPAIWVICFMCFTTVIWADNAEYDIHFEYTFSNTAPNIELLAVVATNDALYAIIKLDYEPGSFGGQAMTTRTVKERVKAPKGLKVVNVLFDPTDYLQIKPQDGLSENGRLSFHLIKDMDTLLSNYVFGSDIIWLTKKTIGVYDLGDITPKGAALSLTSTIFVLKDYDIVIAVVNFKGGIAAKQKRLYVVGSMPVKLVTIDKENNKVTKKFLSSESPFSMTYGIDDGDSIECRPNEEGAQFFANLYYLSLRYAYLFKGIIPELSESDKQLILDCINTDLGGCIEPEPCIIPRPGGDK